MRFYYEIHSINILKILAINIMKITYTFIALILVTSSCRFIAPSTRDTTALNEQGVYNSGTPAWAKLPKNEQINLPANSGYLPETFTVPEAVAYSANANASSALAPQIGRGVEASNTNINTVDKKKNTIKNAITSTQEDSDSRNSEIGKIESMCPGTESAIVDAIKTENVSTRINKYLRLTKRCPTSVSIWLWLAKDYSGIGRIDDAKKCARAALGIDQNNQDAINLIKELNNN